MQLLRGSSSFLSVATDAVLGLGATAVISPPLLAGTQGVWRTAGFGPYTDLSLLRKQIEGEQTVDVAVRKLDDREWPRVVEIDGAAFGNTWRVELPALNEAIQSASTGALMGVEDPQSGTLVGYVIVACSGPSGYLQRIAVHPEYQGRGLGRSLTRAAHNWSLQHGARMMILNTKPANAAALSLYLAEGYVLLPDRLELLRYPTRPVSG